MTDPLSRPVTAFVGDRLLLAGVVAGRGAGRQACGRGGTRRIGSTFDDATGRVIDIDIRGEQPEFLAHLSRLATRLSAPALAGGVATPTATVPAQPRGRVGRS